MNYLLVWLLIFCSADAKKDATAITPEGRAVVFLAREVPQWSPKNKCFSCHNNGDAARALYLAKHLSIPFPGRALDDTTGWLAQPQKWDHNGGEGPFNDKKLARIQFAAALVDAVETGFVKDRRPLVQAAELVAEQQNPDGSWQVVEGGSIGSPATYGPFWATFQARRTLQKADAEKYKTAIGKADQWFRNGEVKSVLDAAAAVMALGENEDAAAINQVRHCLSLIRKGESEKGGWGPYVNSPSENFDSAAVVLALAQLKKQPEVQAMLRRGLAFLISRQQPDGSWEETTRPSGGESYAQRISTTAWVTLALLAGR
jgi:hypothetical protein